MVELHPVRLTPALPAVRSVFNDEKKLSIAALSQTLPEEVQVVKLPFIEMIRLRSVIRRRDICAVSAVCVWNLDRPRCAREGVFGQQAAGASHWAAGRYSSMPD